MALRLARGTYSDARLMKLGIAPPRPMPARNRYSRSCSNDVESAVQSVKTPNVAVAPSSARLRPNRSATGPNANAPSISPSNATLKTGPNFPGPRWSVAAIPGPATPIASRSKPSSSAIRPQSTIIMIWKAPSGRRSMSSVTSMTAGGDMTNASYFGWSPTARGWFSYATTGLRNGDLGYNCHRRCRKRLPNGEQRNHRGPMSGLGPTSADAGDRARHRARIAHGPAAGIDLGDELAEDAVEHGRRLEIDGVPAIRHHRERRRRN